MPLYSGREIVKRAALFALAKCVLALSIAIYMINATNFQSPVEAWHYGIFFFVFGVGGLLSVAHYRGGVLGEPVGDDRIVIVISSLMTLFCGVLVVGICAYL